MMASRSVRVTKRAMPAMVNRSSAYWLALLPKSRYILLMNLSLLRWRTVNEIARHDPAYAAAEDEKQAILSSLPHRHKNIPTPPKVLAELTRLEDLRHGLWTKYSEWLADEVNTAIMLHVGDYTASQMIDRAKIKLIARIEASQ